ncbi:MAG TPA: BadF/BadG/BcrA/BcrD ATPase family protein, partial [Gemmatimonadaceae bacterium]|nr:BadF/BadG/BcrA/BcrD ATPase family protein [Gemmatimonadaceae bacterium]
MSEGAPIVVGVDGGGSKTKVVVADARGKEIGSAEGPGSAVRPGGAEHSAAVISEAVRSALADARRADVRPRVLCVGVAGVGDEPQRQALVAALEPLSLADELVVVPDATVALDDAFGEGAGVLLIAGTGSVAFGRGPAGQFARCGGWGPVFGDEGSGSWIGRRALGIVAASADGREPATALAGAVLTAAQANDPRELIAWA